MTAPTTPAGMPDIRTFWPAAETRGLIVVGWIKAYGIACHEAGRAAARDAALEEAAKECDAWADRGWLGVQCAAAIRALKGKKP